MGVNVVYAPVLDVATNPANPALGIRSFGDDPAPRGRARRRVRPRAAARPAWPPRSSTSRAWATRPRTRTTAWRSSTRRASVLEAVRARCRSGPPSTAGVPAGDVRPRGAARASTAATDLPSTLSRGGHDRPAPRRARVRRRDDLATRSTCGAIAQGAEQARGRSWPRSGPASTCCSRGPIRDAQRRIEAALRRGARPTGARPGASAAARPSDRCRCGAGSARPGRRRTSTSSGRPRTRRSPRELAARSLTLVRDDAGRLPLSLAAGCHASWRSCRRPTDLTPADTSSTVAPGLAAALRTATTRRRRGRHRAAAPTDAEIAAVRDARGGGRTPWSSARSTAIASPSQLALVEAVAAAPATDPSSRSRCGRRGTSRRTRPASPALCTYSILPGSLDALARRAGRGDRVRRPAAGPGRSCRGAHPPPDDAPRRDPRAARGRDPLPGAQRAGDRSGRSPPRSARDRIEHVVIAARGTSDHAAIYAQYVLGIRHGLSVGLATPSVVSLYGAEPRLARSLVVGDQPVGASPDIVARHRGGPPPGRADPGDHERPGVGAGRGGGD